MVLAVAAGLASSANGATVVRAEATGTDSADVRSVKAVNRPSWMRLRITPSGAATGRPYGYDANYTKVYGPAEPVPVRISGRYTIACQRRATGEYEYTTGTFTSRPVTARLPLDRPDVCRITLSGSADPRTDGRNIELDEVVVRLVGEGRR
jgi:hypothetical protein